MSDEENLSKLVSLPRLYITHGTVFPALDSNQKAQTS